MVVDLMTIQKDVNLSYLTRNKWCASTLYLSLHKGVYINGNEIFQARYLRHITVQMIEYQTLKHCRQF